MSWRENPYEDYDPEAIKLLVVQDATHARKLLVEVLRGLGHRQIRVVETFEAAKEQIDLYKPHLMFIDGDLESVDAKAAVRSIRRDKQLEARDLGVIMCAANSDERHVRLARLAGVDEFAARPLSYKSIFDRIEVTLTRPRPFIDAKGYVGPCRRRMFIEDYKGPKRRLSDPIEEEQEDEGYLKCKSRVNEAVQRLADLTDTLNPSQRAAMRAVFFGARDVHETARLLEDSILERCTASMVRYVEGVGATGTADAKVIAHHVAAISQILQLPRQLSTARLAVAENLEILVDKRFGQETREATVDAQNVDHSILRNGAETPLSSEDDALDYSADDLVEL